MPYIAYAALFFSVYCLLSTRLHFRIRKYLRTKKVNSNG